jgi:hypothetical protein
MGRPRSDSHQLGAKCKFCDLGVMSGLRTQPITVGQTEETAEPQVSVSRDHALSSHDVTNSLGRNADFLRQTVPTNAQWLQELLKKELAGGNRLEFAHMSFFEW